MDAHAITAATGDPQDVEALLRRLAQTNSGPYLRPFTPDANWRTARVFIVGTNPATPLRDEFGSFDEYWHALTCDPAAFKNVYATSRGGKPSATTNRINRFTAPLAGVGVLRTNACALPSRRWTELPRAVQREQLEIGRRILGALIEICRPAAILCHGREGVRAVSTLFGTPLDPYIQLERQAVRGALMPSGVPVQLFAYPHLSGIGVKKGFEAGRMADELEALGRRLAAALRPDVMPVG
jgi:hypothetical protein